jgi:deazaflavin-dependent oxidoreductase (nitroreductase family)
MVAPTVGPVDSGDRPSTSGASPVQSGGMATASAAIPARAALPYGPLLSRLLRPIQRAFLLVNGAFVGPALKLGLGVFIGTPAFGHLMLLRTTGRRSGRRREVPLGYVIRDGAIWCVAGYGAMTPWYRNLLSEPRVEVVLPGRRPIEGLARPVTDDREWLAGYRALIHSFGVTGRLVVGDVDRLSDAELLERHRSLPVVRIVPRTGRGIEAGRWDDGWTGVVLQAWLALAVAALLRIRRRAKTGG